MSNSTSKNVRLAAALPWIVVAAFSSMACFCQDSPARLKFEAASVKLAEFPDAFFAAGYAEGAARSPCVLGKVVVSGTLISLTRVEICDIVRIAYDVKSFQVAGVPSALGYSRQEKQQPAPTSLPELPAKGKPPFFYDIQARSPGTRPPSDEQVREMLRALLAERFSLTLHREQRLLDLYALISLASGPKLKSAATDCKPIRTPDFIRFCGFTMEQLAHFLNDKSDRPVVDMTRLSGRFDIEIEIPNDKRGYDLSDIAGNIKALGLRIDPRKDRIEVLVVDHAEKPSAN